MLPGTFTFVEGLWLPGNLPCSLGMLPFRDRRSGGGD